MASLNAELEYKNGVAITSAPMLYQIYQRDENNKAEIKIKEKPKTKHLSVSILTEQKKVLRFLVMNLNTLKLLIQGFMI